MVVKKTDYKKILDSIFKKNNFKLGSKYLTKTNIKTFGKKFKLNKDSCYNILNIPVLKDRNLHY